MNAIDLVIKIQSDMIQGREPKLDDISQIRVRLEDMSKKLMEHRTNLKTKNEKEQLDFIIRRLGEVGI